MHRMLGSTLADGLVWTTLCTGPFFMYSHVRQGMHGARAHPGPEKGPVWAYVGPQLPPGRGHTKVWVSKNGNEVALELKLDANRAGPRHESIPEHPGDRFSQKLLRIDDPGRASIL